MSPFTEGNDLSNYQKIVSLIESSELPCKEEVLASLLPAIRISAERDDIANLPIGSSRMGGMPDLPTGVDWPGWRNPRSGRHQNLDFIAQISMTDVAQFDCANVLPTNGLLFFFYDIENEPWGFDPLDKGSSKVIYHPGAAVTLERRSPPAPTTKIHACRRLAFHEHWTVRDSFDNFSDNLFDDDSADEIEEQLLDLFDEIESLSGSDRAHQLLGNPRTVQNPMELECQLVTNGLYCGDSSAYKSQRAIELQSGADQWKLLLQVDSDLDSSGWMWGDNGRIYYWIKESDLRSVHFNDTWMIFQCH